MRPERDAESIYTSARKLDQALAAGAPKHLVALWLQARRAWWGEAAWPETQDLFEVVSDPVVTEIDPMVTAAIKRRLKQ